MTSAVTALTYQGIMDSLRLKNYVEVPLSLEQVEIDRAARRFLNFLTLPPYIKESFTKMADPKDRGSHCGYASKTREHNESDDKEFFNYRGLTEILLDEAIRKNDQDLRVVDFLESARELYAKAKESLALVIKVIDEHHPGIYEKIFLRNPDRFICIRFVRYKPLTMGGTIAKGHYDRGSCSLTIRESSPGLRIGKSAQTLEEVQKDPGTGLFFPSLTFRQDTLSDEFVPAFHDVIHKAEAEPGPGMSRWAMILFADVESENERSYEHTHPQ